MKIILTTRITQTINIEDDKIDKVLNMSSDKVMALAKQAAQTGKAKNVASVSDPIIVTLADGVDVNDNILFQLVESNTEPEEATYVSSAE